MRGSDARGPCQQSRSDQACHVPRPSWPLNLELQDFNGTLTVEATPRPGFEVPQLTTYLGRVEGVNSFLSFHHLTPIPFTRTPGGFFVRLLVTSEGGTDVTDDAAFELSQRMMGDTLCLFVENREQLGRCSNLELVQTYPTTIIRFSFLRVNWLRRISTPGKIKLRVSDFSASNGWSQGWPLPDGFAEMTPELQFPVCTTEHDAMCSHFFLLFSGPGPGITNTFSN